MSRKDPIENKIFKYIKRKKNVSTYEIAKDCNISWSTAKIKCLSLKSDGKITSQKETNGMQDKIMWSPI